MVMLYENFRHRGKPFILPADKLATHGGFSRRTQHRALLQLEACGLISVKRKTAEAAGDRCPVAPTTAYWTWVAQYCDTGGRVIFFNFSN